MELMTFMHDIETTTYAKAIKNDSGTWLTDWRVDIVHNKGTHYAEAWIYQTDLGNKSFMFGVDYADRGKTFEWFVDLVLADFNEYENSYLKDQKVLECGYDLLYEAEKLND